MAEIQTFAPVALFVLMTLVGLELTLADFQRILRSPRAIVGGTVGQWLLLPTLTWALVAIFDLAPSFAAGAILIAVAPGAGVSNVATAFARGNVALSVSLTAVASISAAITLPVVSSWAIGLVLDESASVRVPVAPLMRDLGFGLVVPIGLGMALRSRNPERADRLAPVLQRAWLSAIAVLIGVGIALSAPAGTKPFEGVGRAALFAGLWTSAAGGLGWAVGSALRLSSDDCTTFAIEFATRNIAVAAIVAMSGLERIDLTVFSLLYGAVGYPLVILAVVVRRRWWDPRRGLEPAV